MKIEKYVSNSIVHTVNANADALEKVSRILAREIKSQNYINIWFWLISVGLLRLSVLNRKAIMNLTDQNLLLAAEIDKLKAEKKTAAEETEM